MTQHKNKFFYLILLFIFLVPSTLIHCTTVVYSLKTRRSFTLGTEQAIKQRKRTRIFTAAPNYYHRTRHIIEEDLGVDLCEKDRSAGVIFNLKSTISKKVWLEATTAIQNEKIELTGSSCIKKSRTALDDIVLSAGRNFFLNDKTQLVIYGLAGIPATQKITNQETYNTLVGTRFFSLGIGGELSQGFVETLKKSVIGLLQGRFVHFFNRKWDPILPVGSYVQPGNVTDLLVAMQFRYKRDLFELGYNPTFFTNQAVILLDRKVESKNFVRQSVYIDYAHIFGNPLENKKPFILGASFSTNWSDRFDTRIYSAAVLLSWVF